MDLDVYHLLFFILGGFVPIIKDYIQQKLFLNHMNKIGQQEIEQQMEKMLNVGFGLNEDVPEGADSKNIEAYYKGYYS